MESGCLVKVDEYGFFIYWKSEGKVRSTGGKWVNFERKQIYYFYCLPSHLELTLGGNGGKEFASL